MGKTTRPARHDLNQIPHEYAVEVLNRFKGLDLVKSIPEELWMEVHNIVQEAVNKTILKKRIIKQAKLLSAEALQIAGERRMELEESTCLTSGSTTKPQSSRQYGTGTRQKYRSMEQNRKPRDKSTHLWTRYL